MLRRRPNIRDTLAAELQVLGPGHPSMRNHYRVNYLAACQVN